MAKLNVHDEESESFQPMELDTDASLEKSDKIEETKSNNLKRTFAIVALIVAGVFIVSVIIPQSKQKATDVEPSSLRKVPKAKPRAEVPKYEPKSWCLNVSQNLNRSSLISI